MEKLREFEIPASIIRWMASFLLNRAQSVKIGNVLSKERHPNGGVPQGTLSGPKDFLIHINQLKTECPLFKYVDDCTIFECLTKHMETSVIIRRTLCLVYPK